ncbi:MAG: alpha/beta hydrolase [Gammaproteobacteria bacterium]|nr:alpha/beta hydrolase [Gammaproteobacteria bacterium]
MTWNVERRFVNANRMTFEVFCAGEGERGAQSERPERLALCLHGFPEHAYSWRHQMPVLAKLGYRVWAPNLRGYGNSSRPPRMEDYAIEHLMEDVAELIDASGCRETVLIGHDWGAVIAWLFAARKLRPLERLIIMNVPHPALLEATIRKNREQMARSWYVLFFQIPALPEWLMKLRGFDSIGEMFRRSSQRPEAFTDEDVKVFAENVSHPGALTAMINYYRAAVRGGGARRQRALGYPVIEVPTLMVWGEEDIALSKATTVGTEEYVSDLTLRYIPGASHWVQQEVPETVNEMLTAYLTHAQVPHAPGAQGDVG